MPLSPNASDGVGGGPRVYRLHVAATRLAPAQLPRPRGAFTTCWVTSGSGARIGTERIPRARRLIRKGPRAASKRWGAGHPSSMVRTSSAFPCAAEIRLKSRTQTWVSVAYGKLCLEAALSLKPASEAGFRDTYPSTIQLTILVPKWPCDATVTGTRRTPA